MHLINSPQQQNCIIRGCCLRPLAFELGNLNCVTSSGFPLPHISKIIPADGNRFSAGLHVSSEGWAKTVDECTSLDLAPRWQKYATISDTSSILTTKTRERALYQIRGILFPSLAPTSLLYDLGQVICSLWVSVSASVQ